MELKEFELFLDDEETLGMEFISIVEEPAHDSEALKLAQEKVQFAAIEDRQMLYGAILIPDIKILRVPEVGDPYYVTMTAETIQKIAYKFNQEGKQSNIDYDHTRQIQDGIALVENWIVEDTQMDKAKALGLELPKGTWFGGTHVTDKSKWEELKLSRRTGFSVDGLLARREKQNDPLDVIMSKVKDLHSGS